MKYKFEGAKKKKNLTCILSFEDTLISEHVYSSLEGHSKK